MTASSRPTIPSAPFALQGATSISGRVGRCDVFEEVASGGMATIYLGRWRGAGGFSRPVAIKALHPQFARDLEFRAMLLDEARVVARINHPNVMPTLDLIEQDRELYIVMEYVLGATLSHLVLSEARSKRRMPPAILLRIMSGVLTGLQAAHEAKDARGQPLGVIHRDVSPENILVGVDGYPRLIDFGIARALGRHAATRQGELKGKVSYMAPEQLLEEELSSRSDVYGASVVLWQSLTARKLFRGDSVANLALKILHEPVLPPSQLVAGLPRGLDAIVLKGLARDPEQRWQSAQQMAEAIDQLGVAASRRQVGTWVKTAAADDLAAKSARLRALDARPLEPRRPEGSSLARRSVPSPVPAMVVMQEEPSHTDVTAEADASPQQTHAAGRGYLLTLAAALASLAIAISLAVGVMQQEAGQQANGAPSPEATVASAPSPAEAPSAIAPVAVAPATVNDENPSPATVPSAGASAVASSTPSSAPATRTPRRARAQGPKAPPRRAPAAKTAGPPSRLPDDI